MLVINTKQIKCNRLGIPNGNMLRYRMTTLKTYVDCQERERSIMTMNVKKEVPELHPS